MAIQTKRSYITNLYIEFQKELLPFDIDVSKIFPKIEDLDIAELVMNYNIYFTDEKQWETTTKTFLQYSKITVSVEVFSSFYAVIKSFLTKFSKIA